MIAMLFGLLLGLSDLDQAERAYGMGRYGEAYTLYRAALSEPDVAKGPVLYNLGVCAYRLGRHAEAVLCFRRAKRRLPRDPEVNYNLVLAERKLGVDDHAYEPFGAAVKAMVDSFRPAELLALVGGLQLVGLAGLVLLRKRRAACYVMALLVLLALAGAARLVHDQWFASDLHGVVLNRGIAPRAEPHADFPVLYKLKAGETVRIEEMSDTWVRIDHAKGGGWIERADVGVVD